MKTLLLLFLLMFPEVFLTAQTNSDSVYQYFPMNVGNVWKYITDDSVNLYTIRSERKYSNYPIIFSLDGPSFNGNYYTPKIDSLNGDVYLLKDLICDNFRVLSKQDDTSNIACDSVRAETVFGKSTVVRYMKVKVKLSNTISHHRSAWGLGTISGNENHPFAPGQAFNLYYAFINGKHFGKALIKKQEDSLLQYHPFQKGNKWIYNKKAYSSYGNLIDSSFVTRESLGDSIINGKKYCVYSMCNNKTNSLTYEFLFFDSTSGNVYQLKYGKHYLYDSLLCTSGAQTMFKISSSNLDSLFGKRQSSRSISDISQIETEAKYKFIYGFGLVNFGYEYNLGDREQNTLVYAKINGKEYGTNPSSVQTDKNISPKEFSLFQNYPNPFNPTTVINYQLATKSIVSLKVFDIIGREVALLVNEQKDAGIYAIRFNASALASGLYFYQLRSGNFVETKKMILLK